MTFDEGARMDSGRVNVGGGGGPGRGGQLALGVGLGGLAFTAASLDSVWSDQLEAQTRNLDNPPGLR